MMHGKMVRTATKQLNENVRKRMKYWSRKRVTVEEYRLGSRERREVAVGMSRTETNLWTPLSVRKSFVFVEERSFPTYVTDGI